jgi:transcriptional antiterminator NusG
MEDEKEQTDLSGTSEAIEGEPVTTAAPASAAAPELEEGRPGDLGEEAAVAQAGQTPPPAYAADEKKRWYIVHTYSGYEQKVKQSIEKQIARLRSSKLDRDQRLAGYFGEILIPTENVVELVKGQRRTTSRKFFPGYILVQMEGNQESWHLVRETPKISGFVGGTKEPTPITEEELNRILRQEKEGAERPKPKIQFERGENVRVVAGPFANFTGVVDDVKPEKAKVKVLVTIFGRATPVELSFIEVEKA